MRKLSNVFLLIGGIGIVLVLALDVYLKDYRNMLGWGTAFVWWYSYFGLKTSIEDFMRK